MPLLLPEPVCQFCDADGAPYAGGTVTTYVPGSGTLKATWADNLGDVVNPNPLTLDAAGRCLLFGDGDYRLVLHDSAGNLIYDQWTSSVVSDAMQPIVAAPTLEDAQNLLGIVTQAGITAQITAETQRAQAAEASLQTGLNNEITRAENAEAGLQNAINTLAGSISGATTGGVRAGVAITDASSRISIMFNPAFTTGVVVASISTVHNVSSLVTYNLVTLSTTQWVTGIAEDTGTGPSGYLPVGAGVRVEWYAIGY